MLQLLGDSILKRLFSAFPDDFHNSSKFSVISGATVSTITDVSRSGLVVQPEILLMVGVNNVLQGDSYEHICVGLRALIKKLKRICKIVFVCHILGIARENGGDKNAIISRLNIFIDSFEIPGKVRVLRVFKAFLPYVPQNSLFCQKLKLRVDLVHLNAKGLKVLREFILATTDL